ncbi:MAG: 2-dehydro-3-deoxygalactonokinase [Burkholderiales bacterium]|nr:2-dehydro-3-deoxygalactonokinase [Burkholderiales bacterium]
MLHRLFGVRARGLFGELSAEHSGAYLSGLLIGSELSTLPPALEWAYLLGSSELTRLYQHALARKGVRVDLLDQDAVVTGLLCLKTELEGREI